MVGTDCRGEEFMCAAVRASADPTTGLGVVTAVGVEVSVANGVVDTQETTVGVDALDVRSGVAIQGIAVATPLGTGGIQTYSQNIFVGD